MASRRQSSTPTTRVLWIEKGELIMDGEPKAVVDAYNEHTGSSTID